MNGELQNQNEQRNSKKALSFEGQGFLFFLVPTASSKLG
jgi:hypothetical protein